MPYGVSIVILTAICSYLLFESQDLISNNSQWLSFLFGIIGALAGGIIGGLGSYLGSKAQIVEERKRSRKRITAQLKFTHDLFKDIDEAESVVITDLIYDRDWRTDLAAITELTEEEYSNVVHWFYILDQLRIKAEWAYAQRRYVANIVGADPGPMLPNELPSSDVMRMVEPHKKDMEPVLKKLNSGHPCGCFSLWRNAKP